jgi:tRNA wybutosine-synthesizing protein 1
MDGKVEFSEAVKKRYGRIYGLAGRHSGVQICSWNKKALRGKEVCYKQKFYGIECYKCCQMSPALAWCQQKCVFCWRPAEWMKRIEMKESEVDSPKEIIEACVKERKRLLSGIGGAYDANRGLFDCSFEEFPSHWAISLSGEPTIYPRLGELVKALRARKEVKSIFLVTNGQEPERLEQMAKDGALPTQLYLSVDAPNKKMFMEVNRPSYADGWERLCRTISLMPRLKCRRVIRFTMIKGVNDREEVLPDYAELFRKSKTDFIEVKAYMFLGLSRERLKEENMPFHTDVRDLSAKLVKHLKNYEIIDEDAKSRIVLFKRKDSPYENPIRKA